MHSYDSDFYRQCYEERMAQLRKDYQRSPARSPLELGKRLSRYAGSASAWLRWRSPRRAPALRA
jgi:hypothetical protein